MRKYVKMLDIDFDKWFEDNYGTLDELEKQSAKSIARSAWETAGSIEYARGYDDGLQRLHE